MQTTHLRLGVNIDHVATIRNARGHQHPDPLRAALLAVNAGADGITAHLREDRRHISDADIRALVSQLTVPLNLEMAATEEMLGIALNTKPNAACIVPEKRQELTTEGGLDVCAYKSQLAEFTAALKARSIRVSLFVDADVRQLEAAAAIGADIVEIHTGRYCEVRGLARKDELLRIREAAYVAAKVGLECHAGHGLSYETVEAIAAIPNIVELNIGHFLIGEAVFAGLATAIKTMREHMDNGRARAENA